jgi:hypothetical protein
MIAINQIQEAVLSNRCSMGVNLQTTKNEDDDHPPSNQRTCRCAFNSMILSAWVRKV